MEKTEPTYFMNLMSKERVKELLKQILPKPAPTKSTIYIPDKSMKDILNEYGVMAQQIMAPQASQEELDTIGHLLDRLEEIEIYLNSPSDKDEKEKEDSKVEMTAIMDRLDMMIEKV